MSYDPVIALSLFLGISILIYVVYKFGIPEKIFRSRSLAEKTLIEDILKQLYHVEYSGRFASLNGLAGALKIKDARLIELIETMNRSDLIKNDQSLIKLTPSGTDYALKIIRVHRLWEKYLSEKTGYDKSEWHDRAELMEHSLTQKQTRELNEALGNPRFDPHGDPIPTESGEIIYTTATPLPKLSTGSRARIVHIEDEPDVIYRQIIDERLHIGSQVKILQVDEHDIHFVSEGNEYRFSNIVASNIHVDELSEKEVYEENAIRLSALEAGQKAKILGISSECRGAARRRLLDLGFIRGSLVETAYDGTDHTIKAFNIRNTLIALRQDQSDFILIEKAG